MVHVIIWETLTNYQHTGNMQCVILAGGLGTRVSGITLNKIPKSLIEINNKPFIDYQLCWLRKYNIENILLCVDYLGNQIKDYVKDGNKWNLCVDYSFDGDVSLGTGGAIRKALDNNKLNNDFMIMYGDSFLPIDYSKIYNFFINKQELPALMTVFKNNNDFDNSNANLNNWLVDYNKFQNNNYKYIDYGLSILNKNIIGEYILSNTKYDLSNLFTELSKRNMLSGYEIFERFYEIGSVDGLKDFSDFIKNEK